MSNEKWRKGKRVWHPEYGNGTLVHLHPLGWEVHFDQQKDNESMIVPRKELTEGANGEPNA